MEDIWEVLEEGSEAAEEYEGRRREVSDPDSHAHATPSGRTLTREMVLHVLKVTKSGHASLDKQLAKATHLHLNGMRLIDLGDRTFAGLSGLETLYLFDNVLTHLHGLSQLRALTSLYLQNNQLSALEAVQALPRLQKLYVEGNALTLITGLGALKCLEELHVSNQRGATDGGGLRFDADCMAALAPSLRVLCAVNCGIQDRALSALHGLYELRKLDLSQNALDSCDALEEVVRSANQLVSLDLQGNPMCRHPKYRETVVVMSDSLAVLDGQPINAQQRQVLLRLQIKRMKAQMAVEQQQAAVLHGGRSLASAPDRPPPSGPGAAAGPGALSAHAQHRGPIGTPPVSAGFGAPRHLAHQVSASGRKGSGTPSIPSLGGGQGLDLGMHGVQLLGSQGSQH